MGGGKAKGAIVKPVQMSFPAKRDDADNVEVEEEEDEEEAAMDVEEGKIITSASSTKSSNSVGATQAHLVNDSSPSKSVVGKTSASDNETTESPLSTTSEDRSKDSFTPAAEIKVKIKIGESNSAKRKSGPSSVSAAVKAAGIETGPKLSGKTSDAQAASSSKSSSSKIDLSVSSILASRATEVYNEERMKDPQFSMWVPPTNQAGDGKTKLNEKYGY